MVEKSVTDKVSLPQSLAYSLPCMPILMLVAGTDIIQGIYAKYFGIPLISIAMVV